MNIRSIRRIILTTAMTVAALSAMAVSAQPLPPAALPQPIGLIGPSDGATVTVYTDFEWQATGASSYVLKWTINETGEKLKVKIEGDACGLDTCLIDMYDTPVFDAIKDGQSAQWRVVGKYTGGKYKTPTRTLIANTVETPFLMSPANGANLMGDSALIWSDGDINVLYTVVVKHNSTGAKVLKHTIHTDACPVNCAIIPGAVVDLTPGTYKWFVKSQGYNGTKLKSPVRTFVVPLAEVSN